MYPRCPGTNYVDQADPAYTESCLGVRRVPQCLTSYLKVFMLLMIVFLPEQVSTGENDNTGHTLIWILKKCT